MKKFMRGMICLMLALCMVMCFAACEKDEDDKKSSKSVAGTYQFYEMTQDGETITMADLEEQLDAAGMAGEIDMDEFCYLELDKDGTGILVLMGEEMEMEYDDEYIWPVDEADEKVEYTFKSGKLTMEQDGMKLVFKK